MVMQRAVRGILIASKDMTYQTMMHSHHTMHQSHHHTTLAHAVARQHCILISVLIILLGCQLVWYSFESEVVTHRRTGTYKDTLSTVPTYGKGENEKKPAVTPTNKTNVDVHSPPIQQISLLGERNSGTRWTYAHLSQCFNHTLRVELFLTRYKHWFQDPTIDMHPLERETLVIAQFRNPYDWLEAMRNRPHHAPNHLDVPWKEFLSTPWTMDRIGSDLNITSNETECRQGFKYNQINSCAKMPLPREAYMNLSRPFRMSRHQPFYELKQEGSGEPFESIMDMRAAKIKNFLETKNYPRVADTWPAQYEYLLAKGTKKMLDRISEITGVPYTCDPFPVQAARRKRELAPEYMDYVTEHVDWETEKLIGYHSRDSQGVDDVSPSALLLSKSEITWNVKRDQERDTEKKRGGAATKDKKSPTKDGNGKGENEKTPAVTPTNKTNVDVHSPPIQQISLLGERNSGTRWTYAHLSQCFNHTLRVELFLTRYKHWFQDPMAKMHPLKRETLVIAQFRNPYDWLEAMRDRPHHAPNHLDVPWQKFLSTPWTMDRIGSDLNIASNETECQHGFKFNQINSCTKYPLPKESYLNLSRPFRMSRHQPFYELKQDGSGEPFESIMEMRAAKIKNFLETKNYPHVADTWPVHYEYLLAKGTREMLERISELTGVPYTCDPFPVQAARRKRELAPEYVDYVTERVDWETEKLIGYHSRDSQGFDDVLPSALLLSKPEITWNVKT